MALMTCRALHQMKVSFCHFLLLRLVGFSMVKVRVRMPVPEWMGKTGMGTHTAYMAKI